MRFKEHCDRTRFYFGQPYEEIHHWLDEFTGHYSQAQRYKHRKHRHHREGVLEARERFGDLGALVAILHIMDDNEGTVPYKKEYQIEEYED